MLVRLRWLTATVFIVILVAAQSGCSNGTADPIQATSINPTIAATTENTGQAIPTGVPPTPSIAPPSVVDQEIDTAANTPTPAPVTAVPIPEGVLGPRNFPPNVNPLTGEIVADPAVLARRPVAIKISNAPAIVRPQSGINNADLVFEHYAEGGLTRFTAVFYSKDADPVGSIRSGRIIDLEIPKMYDAAFAYSGASGPVRLMFADSEFFDRIVSPDFGHGGFFRVETPNKAFEHTLFTNTFLLRSILGDRGQDTPPQFRNGMTFSQAPLTTGDPASQIEIGYDGTYVTWAFNTVDGRYTRWTDGIPHLDANTGHQLSFKNIILLAAHHEDTTILKTMSAAAIIPSRFRCGEKDRFLYSGTGKG